jgi:hypothetical protein
LAPAKAGGSAFGHFGHESLAEMVGTAGSRVSFFTNKFRKRGFVAYDRGGLSVHRSLLDVLLHDWVENRPSAGMSGTEIFLESEQF